MQPKLHIKIYTKIIFFQDNLNTSDFAELSAPLLYDMFKAHTTYPLHLAIHHLREDVVFLFLIEYNAQVRLSKDRKWVVPRDTCFLIQCGGLRIVFVIMTSGCMFFLPYTSG